MKILFLTNTPPSYPSHGAIIQSHHFMRLLAKDHQIGLWTYCEEDPDKIDYGPLDAILAYRHAEKRIKSKFLPEKIKRWGKWLSGKDPMARWSYDGEHLYSSIKKSITEFNPDIVVFEQLHMSYPISRLVNESNRPVLAFNAHDAIHVVLRRSYQQDTSKSLTSFLNQHFVKVIKNFEHKIVGLADVVFSVSEVDAGHLQSAKLAKQWAVTPNGVDTEHFTPLADPGEAKPLSMVFIGSLDYGPNVQAIDYYINSIHQKLRAKHPDCVLKIVGRPTKQTEKYEGIPGIDFVGFQREFRPFFEEAHISIVPLLSGSGTRFKILESWAMGKAMVSTSIGAEGLAYKDGENILIADDPDMFVDHILKLYEDQELRKKLATVGRKVVEDHYSWKSIVKTLDAQLVEAVEGKS